MYWKPLTACIAAGMFLSAPSLIAAPHHHTGSARQAKLSALDKAFMIASAQSNLMEIEMKPLVMKRGRKFATRTYAAHLAGDHLWANRRLTVLAAHKGVTLPTEISSKQQAIVRRLTQKSPMLFDAAYKHEMIRDHREDMAKARREVSLGYDREVRSYAQHQLGLLKMHLHLAYPLPGYTPHSPQRN
jgi:predicted outer membrane protein